MNSLAIILRKYTTVVADTGDLQAIQQFKPLDATTNPSLITQSAKNPQNDALLEQAYQQAKNEHYQGDALFERTVDLLTVRLGVEILKHIDGRVSTEVDANLSYDTQATIDKALQLLEIYQSYGIDKERILIKIASTWQGIQAARYLEQQGIHCNLTLLFSLCQAQACADAQVTLISPFVGRILDWQKKQQQCTDIAIADDLGVQSVQKIYHYYKQHEIKTQIMGASFRTCEQIIALAGCDLLTISPTLLAQLNEQQQQFDAQLSVADAKQHALMPYFAPTEADFNTELEQNQMMRELLTSGIQGFIQAKSELVSLLKQRFVA